LPNIFGLAQQLFWGDRSIELMSSSDSSTLPKEKKYTPSKTKNRNRTEILVKHFLRRRSCEQVGGFSKKHWQENKQKRQETPRGIEPFMKTTRAHRKKIKNKN